MKHELNGIITIAARDLIKLLRDRPRLMIGFVFPLLFIGILGGSLQSNLGASAGYNLLVYVFTGVLGQTLFQSTAMGVISLIADRENDFSQEIFVSPISRYSIIIGKILGETLVSLVQGIGIILFGLIVGVPITFQVFFQIFPAVLVSCLFGGSFGVIVLSKLSDQRQATQIFPIVIFPQFFLSGVFSPIQQLPWYLDILSKISPMRYAVDFVRNFFYLGNPEATKAVLFPMHINLIIITVLFTVFIILGTRIFVNNERNR